MSVNLPLEYLRHRDRLQEIAALIRENGVIPCTLGLEIAERQAMEDVGTLGESLLYLKNFGAEFYLDDFGAGYSSLRLLAALPVRGFKMDRYFLDSLFETDKVLTMVRWMVSLGQSLELDVIAKGIETPEQRDFLQSAGCPYAQGYYFSAALDPEAVVRFLAQGVLPGGVRRVGISRLRPFELFTGFRDDELAQVALACEELTIRSDSVLIRQGQVGSELYLLEEGSLSVYREQKEGAQVLSTLHAPSVFGEMALVNPERIRTASVKALSESRLLAIHVGDFRALLRRFPELKTRLQQLIAQRLSGR